MVIADVDRQDADFGSKMLVFARGVDQLGTPAAVLDGLHAVAFSACNVSVLGALLLPLRWGDFSAIEQGKTVFFHKSVPAGWWDEFCEHSRQHPGLGLALVQAALAPFTMSETMRQLEPLGIDRWTFELALKHGMRDRLNCPVGGRWLVSYWSRHDLSNRLSPGARALLFMGATFAAIRLQALIGPQLSRIGKAVRLTPREIAVLRLISYGHQIKEAASALQLGEETVRSHLKKAQAKLGVRNRVHAVAQAVRLQLIS